MSNQAERWVERSLGTAQQDKESMVRWTMTLAPPVAKHRQWHHRMSSREQQRVLRRSTTERWCNSVWVVFNSDQSVKDALLWGFMPISTLQVYFWHWCEKSVKQNNKIRIKIRNQVHWPSSALTSWTWTFFCRWQTWYMAASSLVYLQHRHSCKKKKRKFYIQSTTTFTWTHTLALKKNNIDVMAEATYWPCNSHILTL